MLKTVGGHVCVSQGPIFNTSLPLGVRFVPRSDLGPRGELWPLGRMFTPSFSPPRVKTLYCLEKTEGWIEDLQHQRQTAPLRVTFRP
jgi:hypothetical protein